jgi:hypothetical protein
MIAGCATTQRIEQMQLELKCGGSKVLRFDSGNEHDLDTHYRDEDTRTREAGDDIESGTCCAE